MSFNTYLHFKGRCAEAFGFYQTLFGASAPHIQTWGESPMGEGMPPARRAEVMHAHLQLGSDALMGADAGDLYEPPRGFRVCAEAASTEEAERWFAALSEGGEVFHPLAETAWAKRFGMLTDRFGIPWMVIH